MNYEQIGIIDNLPIYNVPVHDITESGHGYEGEDIRSPGEWGYYGLVLSSIEKVGIETPLVLYALPDSDKLGICDGWHRWKLSLILELQYVPAVIFPSKELCKPTPNIPW